jgi:hypothetical protein
MSGGTGPDHRHRLTRRAVLESAAAAGAGMLLRPAASVAATATSSASPAVSGRVFGRSLGSVAGVSAPIDPGRGFVLAGIRWSTPRTARIELRARIRGAAWGPWLRASVLGHVPDRAPGARGLLGEPVWLGVADQLQVRSRGIVHGVEVSFVAPAEALAPRALATGAIGAIGASAAALPLAAPVLPAGAGQPPIIARTAWAGQGALPSGGPYYGSVRLAFVHHSDNLNGYSAPDVPAMILAIYDYHRFANGWFDIGYNFVIDAFGRIWEARAGGIDEPVIGAHAGGYNAVCTGIAMLGTFMDAVPPPPAMEALIRLLAWKLPLHGAPALGVTTVAVEPTTPGVTAYAPGRRVTLPRIAGHRDGDLTDCPGNDLYARLPALRAAVDRRAGGRAGTALLGLHLSRTSVPAPGGLVTAGGTLTTLDGAPLTGAPVEVQSVTGLGDTTTIATVLTDARGGWTAAVSLTRTMVVRALHRDAPAAVSDAVTAGLVPVITLAVAPASPLRVQGTIRPTLRRVTLDVYKLAGAHRRHVLTRTLAVRGGRFATGLSRRTLGRGRYVLVARSAAGAVTVAGASAPLTVTL